MKWLEAVKRLGPLFDSFWSRYPALLYGLALYIGAVSALAFHPALLIPIILLVIPLAFHGTKRLLLRLGLALLMASLFSLYVANSCVFPPVWARSKGCATIQIEECVPEMRYGKAYYKMKASLLLFEADDKSFYAKNIPCRIISKTRPPLDRIYYVEGALVEANSLWTLKVLKTSAWQEEVLPFSLQEWRFKTRQMAKCLLAAYLPPGEVRAFLEGVLLGEFHDVHLAANLRRFGLTHITVVSGFHFSLIAAILTAILRLFLPWRSTLIASLLLTTGYFFFIGPSPSVLRAWIAVSIFIMAKLLEKASRGLNTLGVCLMASMLYDPTWVQSLSFTLSFLATFAILLLMPLCKSIMSSIFPKRSGSDLLKMSFLDQVTFVLLSFFLSSWALISSVMILMLPVSLYFFGTFPLMGIIYNCFFPFIVSIAVLLLALGLIFAWIKPFAYPLFWLAEKITSQALTFVTDAPSSVDCHLALAHFPLEWLVAYLSMVSFLGIIFCSRRKLQEFFI